MIQRSAAAGSAEPGRVEPQPCSGPARTCGGPRWAPSGSADAAGPLLARCRSAGVHWVRVVVVHRVADRELLVRDEQERDVVVGGGAVLHPASFGEPHEAARPVLAFVGLEDASRTYMPWAHGWVCQVLVNPAA